MNKTVNFSKTIFDLCLEDESFIEIMKELGFDSITKPGMLRTAGRIMTIPTGAGMRGMDLHKIKAEFEKRGYKVIE